MALLGAVKSNGSRVETRREIVVKGMLQKEVFLQASPFLRVRHGNLENHELANSDFDPLDDTRIHPRLYQ